MAGTRPSWREEARQDRLTTAQIERDRETARVQARITERQAVAQLRRETDLARAAARQQARARRAARWQAWAAWIRAHTIDLLFVPVIVVPAVLAWSAMATYGGQLYGAAGLVLPAFSEGAMWAFAFATTWTARRYPARPTWHLRAGTWAFTAVAGALNFLHGLTVSVITGVVYALISVAGVVVHQFITAGPRRSRTERDQARIARMIRRRERKVRKAAVRSAVAELDEHGRAHLVYTPGLVDLDGHGRRLLTPATPAAAAEPVRAAEPVPELRTGDASSEPEADRTGPDSAAEDDVDQSADPVDFEERRASTDRAALVADLAGEIRAAMDAGDRWTPDYDALMARTGFRRSWCEKVVKDARAEAFTAAVPAPADQAEEVPA